MPFCQFTLLPVTPSPSLSRSGLEKVSDDVLKQFMDTVLNSKKGHYSEEFLKSCVTITDEDERINDAEWIPLKQAEDKEGKEVQRQSSFLFFSKAFFLFSVFPQRRFPFMRFF